jgi:hypothetical protein
MLIQLGRYRSFDPAKAYAQVWSEKLRKAWETRKSEPTAKSLKALKQAKSVGAKKRKRRRLCLAVTVIVSQVMSVRFTADGESADGSPLV